MSQCGSSFIQYPCLRFDPFTHWFAAQSHGTILTFGLFRNLLTLPALARE